MKSKHLLIAASALALVALGSCGGNNNDPDPDPKESFDEAALLANYSANLITPSYVEASSAGTELGAATGSFTESPSANTLEVLRSAWVKAATKWQLASVYQFGPANDVALRENVNTYPVDTALINSNIRTGSYDLASIANYDAKGLQTVDYLLFGIGTSDAAIIEMYTTDTYAANRKQYLTDIVTDINTNLSSVQNSWQNGYGTTFDNATGVDVGSSIGLMVNEMNLYFERYVRDGKVGIPAGARTFTQTPLPEKAEAYYNGQISRALLVESMKNLKSVYTGTDLSGNNGKGFDDYLRFNNAQYNDATLDETIQNQFDLVIANSENLNSASIATEAESNQDDLLSLFDDMQFLNSLLKVEMANSMEVQITYKDSDGD